MQGKTSVRLLILLIRLFSPRGGHEISEWKRVETSKHNIRQSGKLNDGDNDIMILHSFDFIWYVKADSHTAS